MAQIRFKGFKTGATINLSASAGGQSGSVVIPAYRLPAPLTAVPRVRGGQFAGDTLAMAVQGTATAYAWRTEAGAVLGTGASFDSTGHGGIWIQPGANTGAGMVYGPPVLIHAMGMMADHDSADKAILRLVPHDDITHLAVSSGNWTDPASWHGGAVPGAGARVLVARGVALTYDAVAADVRLDWLRVDGTLRWPQNVSTRMLVETVVVTRGGMIEIGTAAQRIAAGVHHDICISDRHYRDTADNPTDINLARDPELWGRGVICQGTLRAWGTKKDSWKFGAYTPEFDGTKFNWRGIKAGDTSLRLQEVPTGWSVGDEIIIGGTGLAYPDRSAGRPLDLQDEIRTITAIDGTTLHFAGQPLQFDHDNQNPVSTSSDLYPVIMLRKGRAITIRSENPGGKVYRRGHVAVVHHHSVTDVWDCALLGLGRTDKSRDGGQRFTDGSFRRWDTDSSPERMVYEPFTPRSNIISRYAFHFHHVGEDFDDADMPVLHGCYVEDVPGWGIVHHACKVATDWNVVYDFYGAGMVGETGNELGRWSNNVSCHARTNRNSLDLIPKILEGQRGLHGDTFATGYGFAMHGRAIKHVGNIAISCTWGHVFFHRGELQPATSIAPPVPLNRAHLDLQNIGYAPRAHNSEETKFDYVDYPLHLTIGNIAIACISGLFVTKAVPQQLHDAGVVLKDFLAWGYLLRICTIEYVGKYAVHYFRGCRLSPQRTLGGVNFGNNTFNMATYRITTEGGYGIEYEMADTIPTRHEAYSTTDPRWVHNGSDFVDAASPRIVNDYDPLIKSFEEVASFDPDWSDTNVDEGRDPTHNIPLFIGQWDGQRSGVYTRFNNLGRKIDNYSDGGKVLPTGAGDYFGPFNGYGAGRFSITRGWWRYNDGNSVRNVLVLPEILSDRITGRPAKFTFMVESTVAPSFVGNKFNGDFVLANVPVTCPDQQHVTARNTPVTFDVVSGATGGGGPGSYAIDMADCYFPRRGSMTRDPAAGTITYTPEPGYTGTDEFYVFVVSNGQYATVKIDICVGEAPAVAMPVLGTHWLTYEHEDSSTIGVQLLDPPQVGDRKIRLVQYSTDQGATWRRLGYGWRRAIHKVTQRSDGVALTDGVFSVRIRYTTDFDHAQAISNDSLVGLNATVVTGFDRTGLSLAVDYWIDAATGSDGATGTSPGQAWASLSRIEDLTGTPGVKTVVRVKAGTYAKISDFFEINGFDGELIVVFEPGCVMDGTIQGTIGQNPIYAGNTATQMTIHGNGLVIRHFTGTVGGTPNGLGYGGEGTRLTAYDVTVDHCQDGISGHESGHAVIDGCTFRNSIKWQCANISGATMQALGSRFECSASGGFISIEAGLSEFENCVFVRPTGAGEFRMVGDNLRFRNCQLGSLTDQIYIVSKTVFGVNASVLVEDCFINVSTECWNNHVFRRCYGGLLARQRAAAGQFIVENCVIGLGNSLIYSNANFNGSIKIICRNNIAVNGVRIGRLGTAQAAQVVAAGSEFSNNVIFDGGHYGADLLTAAAGGTVVIGTITGDPVVGAANTLDPDAYGYGAGSAAIGAGTGGSNVGFAIGEVLAPA